MTSKESSEVSLTSTPAGLSCTLFVLERMQER